MQTDDAIRRAGEGDVIVIIETLLPMRLTPLGVRGHVDHYRNERAIARELRRMADALERGVSFGPYQDTWNARGSVD